MLGIIHEQYRDVINDGKLQVATLTAQRLSLGAGKEGTFTLRTGDEIQQTMIHTHIVLLYGKRCASQSQKGASSSARMRRNQSSAPAIARHFTASLAVMTMGRGQAARSLAEKG